MFGLSGLITQSQKKTVDYSNDNHLLKRAIWIYFLLLIFEGALRKWFLPFLATPLLVIRDPIALWLIYKSWKRGLLPSTIYLSGIVALGLISFYMAMFVGHGNLIVAIYGTRIFLVHFPLMFIIGRVFDREDVLEIGRATLLISIPMIILVALQFKSPQSAWVNRGLAGDLAGAGFATTGDFFRPPGTFSFTNGLALFFGWLAPFVFYFWFNQKQVKRWLLIGGTVAMLMSIPFSISRTLFFEVVLSLVFALSASLRKPENLGKVLAAVVGGVIILAVLSQTSDFKVAMGAFIDRFTSANESEGGLVKGVIGDRFFGGLISAITDTTQPFWGQGIGKGTNVAAVLLTGDRTILIAEQEWGKLVGELGPLIAISIIILRVGLAFKISIASFKKLAAGDLLPWMLVSFGFINIVQGPWAQPTSLGFGVMIGGIMIAALNANNVETSADKTEAVAAAAII